MKEVMQAPYFRICVVEDEATVELCGALKVKNEAIDEWVWLYKCKEKKRERCVEKLSREIHQTFNTPV